MKKVIGCFFCVLAVSFPGVQAAESGPYVKLELGPSIVEDTDIKEFLGFPAGQTIEFDPGFRFVMGGGYSFNDFVAVGGETGMSYNMIDDISGNVLEGDSGIGNVPMMATVTLKLPNRTGIVPFISAGAGLSFTFFDADDLVNDPNGPNEFILDGSESDTVFAWQLSAGVKYQLNDRMSFGLAYKFMYTDEADWDAEDVFTGLDSEFGIEEMYTHAVTFHFSFKF